MVIILIFSELYRSFLIGVNFWKVLAYCFDWYLFILIVEGRGFMLKNYKFYFYGNLNIEMNSLYVYGILFSKIL